MSKKVRDFQPSESNLSEFSRNSSIVIFATCISFLTQIFIARNAEPLEFSAITSFSVLINLIGIFYSGIQYETTRSQLTRNEPNDTRQQIKVSRFICITAGTTALIIILTKILLLSPDSLITWRVIGITCLYIAIAPLYIHTLGILQSRGELILISKISLSLIASNLSIQILVGLILGFNPLRYLLIQILLVGLVTIYVVYREKISSNVNKNTGIYTTASTILTLFTFNLFANSDLLLSPIILSPNDAGNFSLVVSLARYYLLLIPFLGMKIFNLSLVSSPKVIAQELRNYLRIISVAWLLSLIGFACFGIFFLNKVYGYHYDFDLALYLCYSFASFSIAISTLILTVLLALRVYVTLLATSAFALLYILMILIYDWTMQSLWALNLTLGCLLLISFSLILLRTRRIVNEKEYDDFII